MPMSRKKAAKKGKPDTGAPTKKIDLGVNKKRFGKVYKQRPRKPFSR